MNLYRLVRAGLTDAERREFFDGHGLASDYGAVLFLLALEQGCPNSAPGFHEALASEPADLNAVVRTLNDSDTDASGLREWLEAEHNPFLGASGYLQKWSSRISRYSFRLRRDDMAEYTTPI